VRESSAGGQESIGEGCGAAVPHPPSFPPAIAADPPRTIVNMIDRTVERVSAAPPQPSHTPLQTG